MRLIESYWDSQRLIETHRDSLRLIETHWDSFRLIETHWDSLRLIVTHGDSLSLTESHGDSWRLMETHGDSWRLIWKKKRWEREGTPRTRRKILKSYKSGIIWVRLRSARASHERLKMSFLANSEQETGQKLACLCPSWTGPFEI